MPDAQDRAMQDTAIIPGTSQTVEAVKSITPFLGGDATAESKASYLSYRYTGFSIREACELANIHQTTVMRWRDKDRNDGKYFDPLFVELEEACSGENRDRIRKEVVQLLFTRNFHLMLRKDYEVLRVALGLERDPDTGEVLELSKAEQTYLNRARGQYTPSQVEVIEKLIAGNEGGLGFDYTEFLTRMTAVKAVRETLEFTGAGNETPTQP